MKWWIFWWLVSFVYHDMFSQNCVSGTDSSTATPLQYSTNETRSPDVEKCMKSKSSFWIQEGNDKDIIKAMQNLEKILEAMEINGTLSISLGNVVALLHKPSGSFNGLNIYASEIQAGLKDVPNSTVSVQLPEGLNIGPEDKIVFSKVKLPETNRSIFGESHEVYNRSLVILSVQGKKISGLKEHVKITLKVTEGINETQVPSCHFFNFSKNEFGKDGCHTLWTRGQSNITCSCDHLTYFGVLMVPDSQFRLSPKHLEILNYITLTGCSLSLLCLFIAVLLFITNRTLREDVSMKVHINLVIAVFLLNLHFLPNQTVATWSSPWLCFYMALVLHYSLLATFSWMALEAFNLYLLLVRVLDTYITRYLLKLSVVGWGVPAVIVSVVVIIDREFYGLVPLEMSDSNNTVICYITNEDVKMGTTVGFISLVLPFNMIMYLVTVKRVLSVGRSKELGQVNHYKVKHTICPLLGVSVLLGITWGLVFFSFGCLTIPSLYLFCILNSLQGFFIFLWFVMSVIKTKNSAPKTSRETQSTNS